MHRLYSLDARRPRRSHSPSINLRDDSLDCIPPRHLYGAFSTKLNGPHFRGVFGTKLAAIDAARGRPDLQYWRHIFRANLVWIPEVLSLENNNGQSLLLAFIQSNCVEDTA
jgi:hypothetical protein